tara:strand:- start:12 stop:896 length:885 start_codon:yes stop_codon:yes gene_type:complete
MNMSLFKKALLSIANTKDRIQETFSKISFKNNLSIEQIDSIEECLLSSDISWNLTKKIVNKIKANFNKYDSWEILLTKSIKECIPEDKSVIFKKIIILVGVNGSGKTTTSAKLANMFKKSDKKVTLVAADTFRAAAIDQLEIWANRMNVDFIANKSSNDPASIAYDGAKSGIKNNHDHIVIDTAGRLHTSVNLMKELEKVHRIVNRLSENISVIITLDANIGQNAIKQVREFNKSIPIDSIIINKMDGSAKGGIVLSILDEFNIPVSFIGVGESFEHIIEFNLDDYLNSIIKEA